MWNYNTVANRYITTLFRQNKNKNDGGCRRVILRQLFYRIGKFFLYKNASQGLHCGGEENDTLYPAAGGEYAIMRIFLVS